MLLLLLACTSPVDDAPSITILAPVEGATVCGSPLRVTTEVRGITLVDPFPDNTDAPEPGTGHIDLAMNGQERDGWMFDTEEIVLDDIGGGEWQLKVELSSADHTPIEPYAGDLIYIFVDAAACD